MNSEKKYLHTTKERIRYAETDKMGYCYYGNYARFFEIGRVEALRALGFSYNELENQGIMLPVVEYTVKYLKPAYYDDEITVKTIISETPGIKISFDYEIYNEDNVLLSKANTILVFVDASNMKPRPAPEELVEKIKTHLE